MDLLTVLELLVKRTAHATLHDGQRVLTADGDPVLQAAFAALNWQDPHVLDEA
jgi:hypothetical protein